MFAIGVRIRRALKEPERSGTAADVFTNEMFVETFKLKREGLRGKKLAKSMAARFSSYSADELALLAEHVPSPEVRRRARILHAVFLTLLTAGSISAAVAVYGLFSAGDRSFQGLVLAALLLLFRAVPIYLVARYRRDGAMFVFLGVGPTIARIGSMEPIDVLFALTLVIVAVFWVARMFPNLTWRGQPR